MRTRIAVIVVCVIAACLTAWSITAATRDAARRIPNDRKRVLFWHFWGGPYRNVVRDVVRRFNQSQHAYWVEEVAVPGQNLDMKFFMALAGGDFPDLLNQDDQIIGQWANRGVLMPLCELMSEAEYDALDRWLSPTARKIGTYHGQLFALCNGLDIRVLFYRRDVLGDRPPPRTIAELDAIAKQPSDDESRMLYLPDDRRLWAWGAAFGGSFYDEQTGRVTAGDPRIVEALRWMVSYTGLHGLQKVRAFRSTSRETGAGSMLLEGRYGLMIDGQWRVAELDRATSDGFDYGVVSLPYPANGRPHAGWVNGNFFLVPRGCKNPDGAWAFMKFWSGFGGFEAEAAKTAAAGGWIPAGKQVVAQPEFQAYLKEHPKFQLFVDLADSPHQWPTPNVPVQAYFYERINQATEEALSLNKTPQQALDDATRDIQQRLDEATTSVN